MRIKKHKNKNRYLLTDHNIWIRDFTNPDPVPFEDINKIFQDRDFNKFMENETKNSKARMTWIDSEKFYFENIVIVSDGFSFEEKQNLLAKLPVDKVAILGTNSALKKWRVSDRSINFYVVNNPYEDCNHFLPLRRQIMPKCIASTRTNANFIRRYSGTLYRYSPCKSKFYSGFKDKEAKYCVDDYRNPICAAISLAWIFGAFKILLFCCDNSFKDKKPGARQLDNGLWTYPQHDVVHEIIDGQFYWLKKAGIKVGDFSSGADYNNAAYIEEERILDFFGLNNV